MRRNVGFLIALGVLTGCESMPDRHPEFAPVEIEKLQRPASTNGAIYQAGYETRLFEDQSARRVGDMLTIRLVERTDAKKDSDLNVQKNGSASINIPTILGKLNPALLGRTLETSIEGDRDFGGEGEANQSNSLDGLVTVTVVSVLPNGNLKVRGEKRVTLNQGNEYLRVSGIVRPMDIDAANSVDSTLVADATIMYTGDGAVSDGSKLGVVARAFLSAFFPF